MDDDKDFCDYFQAIAQGCDYEVLTIKRASLFQNAHRHFKPDLTILDLNIPDIDGIELLRLLKREQCQSPIVLISALDEEVILSAYRVGELHGLHMLAAFRKPAPEETLYAFLQQCKEQKNFTYQELSEAINHHDFTLVYQPKISLIDKVVLGAEALIRWQIDDNKLIYPRDFIPLAEESDAIKELTLMTFNQMLEEYAEIKKKNSHFVFSFNLSATLLTDLQLPDKFEEITVAQGINPSDICLEVTETAAMLQPLKALDILTRFRMKKFLLAVDDFGTGFSSLAVLQCMPFHELKIDKSLIKNFPEDERMAMLAKSLINLGKSFGYTVTAEGVETEEALKALLKYDCDVAQGYYIAPPMTMAELQEWLSKLELQQWRNGV